MDGFAGSRGAVGHVVIAGGGFGVGYCLLLWEWEAFGFGLCGVEVPGAEEVGVTGGEKAATEQHQCGEGGSHHGDILVLQEALISVFVKRVCWQVVMA